MFWIKKPTKEELEALGELPLDKNGRKEGLALLKGVKKFLRYNDDLITDDRKELIAEKREAFASALKGPRRNAKNWRSWRMTSLTPARNQ